MQDFGETLADIRDSLDGPLPIRVSQTRVFLASALVMFGFIAVYWRRRIPPPIAMGLPDFRDEADHVVQQFKLLEGLSCSSMQAEQAQELYGDVMLQRNHRNAYEFCLWRNAMQAGMFLSGLTMALLVISLLLTILTDHLFANRVLLWCFVIISAGGAVIHRMVFR